MGRIVFNPYTKKYSFYDEGGFVDKFNTKVNDFLDKNGSSVTKYSSLVTKPLGDMFSNTDPNRWSNNTLNQTIEESIWGDNKSDPTARLFTMGKSAKNGRDTAVEKIKYNVSEGDGNAEAQNFMNTSLLNTSNLQTGLTTKKGLLQMGSGIAQGAANGFEVGGPWGAVVGAFVGAGTTGASWIGGRKRQQQMIDALDNQNRINVGLHNNAINNSNNLNNTDMLTSIANTAALGGNINKNSNIIKLVKKSKK